MGVLYTQNETVVSAFGNMNIFSSVSHPIQAITANLLSDDAYVDEFLDKSSSLLMQSYNLVTDTLDAINIPFVSAEACIFVYCDFSSLLRENTFEGEDELSALLFDYAKLVLTPGKSQRDDRPGFFRICYAYVSREVLEIALSRLAMVVKLLREHGWEEFTNKVDKESVLMRE